MILGSLRERRCRHFCGQLGLNPAGDPVSKHVPRIIPDSQRTKKLRCFSTNPSLFGDAFFGRPKSRAPGLSCSRAEKLPWFQGKPSGHQAERDLRHSMGETVGMEPGQYGACWLSVMLRTKGAKLQFKLRPVPCQNSLSFCDPKHSRPIRRQNPQTSEVGWMGW